METLNPQILRGFRLKSKSIRKIKGNYVIYTEAGKRLIKKCNDSPDQVLFQHEVKQRLLKNDFITLDSFYYSDQKTPYYIFENAVYVMTDYYEYNEFDYGDKALFFKLVKQVAGMHRKARSANSKDSPIKSGNMLNDYIRIRKMLAATKKTVRKNGRFQEFDLLFLNHIDLYLLQMDKAIKILSEGYYEKHMAKVQENKMICHGLLKKENILLNQGDIFITNFSQCRIDSPLLDLSDMIHRHIKYGEHDFAGIKEILVFYTNIMDFAEEDYYILYAFLCFPSSFTKACLQYYSKKRTWTPIGLMERLNLVLAKKSCYESLLSMFPWAI